MGATPLDMSVTVMGYFRKAPWNAVLQQAGIQSRTANGVRAEFLAALPLPSTLDPLVDALGIQPEGATFAAILAECVAAVESANAYLRLLSEGLSPTPVPPGSTTNECILALEAATDSLDGALDSQATELGVTTTGSATARVGTGTANIVSVDAKLESARSACNRGYTGTSLVSHADDILTWVDEAFNVLTPGNLRDWAALQPAPLDVAATDPSDGLITAIVAGTWTP